MNFGEALAVLKQGGHIFRQGWNAQGMWVALMAAGTEPGALMDKPYIYMKAFDGGFVPWVASQTDLLSNDWEVVA
jgi:Protein of unknown function (DUF2829)